MNEGFGQSIKMFCLVHMGSVLRLCLTEFWTSLFNILQTFDLEDLYSAGCLCILEISSCALLPHNTSLHIAMLHILLHFKIKLTFYFYSFVSTVKP